MRRLGRRTSRHWSSSLEQRERWRPQGRVGSGSAARRSGRLRTTRPRRSSTARCRACAARSSQKAGPCVLRVDRSPEAVAFASSARVGEVSQIGAPCPDHLINTKHKPLVVEFDPERDGAAELSAAFREGVAAYASWYRGYYERNLTDESRPFACDPPGPRVVVVPGIGIVTTGADAGKAKLANDLYHRAIAVQNAAEAAGGFRSLSEEEAFAIEYWPLERYKLAQLPAPRELTGRVALITGGASGIGRATARRSGGARGARRRRRSERRRSSRGRGRDLLRSRVRGARSRWTST